MSTKEDPVASRSVLEMLTVAHEYCLFVEKCDEYKQEDILDYMRKISPLLYLKGTLLPDIEPEYPEANERFVIEEQWEAIFNKLRDQFGTLDQYWYQDYTVIDDNDPVKGSLADNYADIYQDLKDFTLLYQKKSHAAKENAVAEIKKLFHMHWGYRLLNAQAYVHSLVMQNDRNPRGEADAFPI